MEYDEALQVAARHTDALMRLDGVNGVGVKLRDGHPALVVDLDPGAAVPIELQRNEIDGLTLVLERNRYQPL